MLADGALKIDGLSGDKRQLASVDTGRDASCQCDEHARAERLLEQGIILARTPRSRESSSYCFSAAVSELVALPIASPDSTSSTRRFCCRPSGVSFEAMGTVLPKPRASIES